MCTCSSLKINDARRSRLSCPLESKKSEPNSDRIFSYADFPGWTAEIKSE